MSGISFYHPCIGCGGTGIRKYNATPGGPLIEENPCSICGGTKIQMQENHGMDDALILQILAELDYIHGKVTAIWNQVKP